MSVQPEQAQRDAVLVGIGVTLLLLVFGGIASSLLFAAGVLVVVLGVLLCLTLIGIVVGVPLIVLGVLLIVASALGGPGLVVSPLVGAGCGLLWYRHRLRELGRG